MLESNDSTYLIPFCGEEVKRGRNYTFVGPAHFNKKDFPILTPQEYPNHLGAYIFYPFKDKNMFVKEYEKNMFILSTKLWVRLNGPVTIFTSIKGKEILNSFYNFEEYCTIDTEKLEEYFSSDEFYKHQYLIKNKFFAFSKIVIQKLLTPPFFIIDLDACVWETIRPTHDFHFINSEYSEYYPDDLLPTSLKELSTKGIKNTAIWYCNNNSYISDYNDLFEEYVLLLEKGGEELLRKETVYIMPTLEQRILSYLLYKNQSKIGKDLLIDYDITHIWTAKTALSANEGLNKNLNKKILEILSVL